MAYVTVAELKSVLGVGNLYPDADLQQVCDAADATVDSYLNHNRVQVVAYELTNNVGTVWTLTPHGFVVGQSVTVAGVTAAFNGAKTVTAKGTYYFSYAVVAADLEKRDVIPSGVATGPEAVDYSTTDAVKEAALTVAVDMWQNRLAPGGQPQAVDFTPSPYRMGRSTLQRVIFLLQPYLDVRGMVG